MIFKIAAIFLVILFTIAIFFGIFVQEKKSILDIIVIISVAVFELRLISYIFTPKSDSVIKEITENKNREDI